mmetsp:Transcript_22197/g.39990  ORF Transcript_22197/g.39990 Transcript_22197/m.39990 type:complete len:758 (+) Transcript_22197:41-2314(+)
MANEEDAKQRAQRSFARIYSDLMVKAGAGPSESSKVAAEAIKEVQSSSKRLPKYFSDSPPKLEVVRAIDAAAAEGSTASAEERERSAKALCSDFFSLCMALKKGAGPPSEEDPNFDTAAADRFFTSLSEEAQEASLEAIGDVAHSLMQQGVDELVASPCLLRATFVMLAHPGLGEPGEFEALKKVLRLVSCLHAQKASRETLTKWFFSLPLPALEARIGQVQQFMTLSLLESQADGTNLEAVSEWAAKGEITRHVRNALRFLNLCWGANELRKQRSRDWKLRRKAQLMRQRGELFEDEASLSLPVTEFHNDAINECGEGILKLDLKKALEMRYHGWKFETMEEERRGDFGIMEYPFILTPVSKVRILSIESLLMQREEARNSMALAVLLRGSMNASPWLVIKVRRSAVVEDALQQLAIHGNKDELKKPLKVVFDGEEGVDEGGVQKEFFQLLVEQLYNEDFGMFERIDESRNFWFNKNSFEANLQFELFGVVLGLAIYNQVILDVKFPMALYKKLMLATRTDPAKLGLSDLMDFQPSLAQGLIALLEHEDAATFQETFGPLRFVVEYECYGSMVEAELVEGGKDKEVTAENREEYVQRYCDYIFSTGVERQYGAFRRGFDQCMSDTLFRSLFRYDELELLICGSKELDFRALETSATYQDGFTASSDPVKWFWEVVHELTSEEKRSLLQFCTGCDRAPVGGLGRLPFILSRAGPDSDILPTVHTCFNHLLIPDYSSKEKLEKRLRLAIQHSTGFGLM